MRHVILGLVADSPSHPYELKQRLSPGLARERMTNDGVLYPLLARLERERLLAKRSQRARGAQIRNVFRITRDGDAEFLAWLRDPRSTEVGLDHDFLVRHRFVKALFFHRLTRSEQLQQLDEAARQTRESIESLRELQAVGSDDLTSGLGWELIELELTQREADLRWIDAITRRVKREPAVTRTPRVPRTRRRARA
ncbi:MAG TPA: PadR family transcriptional regulator [Gemmatimonadaceae bacterium]|nr:PadR family transcriptional regulator [Gemmatimonadaceae bacterium]